MGGADQLMSQNHEFYISFSLELIGERRPHSAEKATTYEDGSFEFYRMVSMFEKVKITTPFGRFRF